MENLNAEQIKKALEFCKSPKLTKCDGCPREKEDGHCMYRLNEDALALINSQEQRIEELTEVVKQSETAGGCEESVNNGFSPSVTELQRENERLRKDNEYILMQHAFQRRPNGDCWNDVIEKAKADTVRKMQERLIAEIENTPNANEFFITAWRTKIDQIAKEMLEGNYK